MKISHLKLFFLIAVLVIIAEGRSRLRSRKRLRSKSTDFDVMIFTQHWPETVCFDWKNVNANHTCNLPVNDEWGIHGIWPTQFHKIGPLYCNKTWHFVAEELTPVRADLENKWIDVENGRPVNDLWKHEWEKHGTCAAVLPEVDSELKYFEKGLQLFNDFDMKYVLAKANIFPGQSYPVQKYLDGVESVLQKRCQIECKSHQKKKEQYLFEVRICFDKLFHLIDCDGIVGFPTECSRKHNVTYPSRVPQDISVVLIP